MQNIFRGLYEKGHLKLKRSLELLSPEEKQAVSEGLSILSRALEKAKKNKSVSLSPELRGGRLFLFDI